MLYILLMEKILITGTKGFIGQNLLNECKEVFDVYEINENIFDTEEWWNNLVQVLYDINPDGIFHVGACSDTLEQDVNYMMTRNFEFTRILTDFCYVEGIPLIYSSSAANYGINNIHPSNLYGWSKYVAEKYVVSNGGIALRYFNVYGPLEGHKGKMSSVAYQMLEKQKKGQEIKLFPLKPKRDFVYVKDVVDANLHAYSNYDVIKPGYYDVGSGESRTFEDVLDILGLEYTYYDEKDIPKGYQFNTKSDPTKFLDEWVPKYNLEKGLKDYQKWLNQK